MRTHNSRFGQISEQTGKGQLHFITLSLYHQKSDKGSKNTVKKAGTEQKDQKNAFFE